MARIGIDLDGVGYEFHNSVWEELRIQGFDLPLTPPGDPDRFAWYEDYGIATYTDLIDLVSVGVDEGRVFTGPVNHGFVEGIDILRRFGHSIHIITARGWGSEGAAARNTLAWLEQHNVYYDDITFGSDKTVMKTDYFIEDQIKNYDALEEAGSTPFLVDRGWNQVEGGDSRRRVDGVRHFAAVVLASEGLKW